MRTDMDNMSQSQCDVFFDHAVSLLQYSTLEWREKTHVRILRRTFKVWNVGWSSQTERTFEKFWLLRHTFIGFYNVRFKQRSPENFVTNGAPYYVSWVASTASIGFLHDTHAWDITILTTYIFTPLLNFSFFRFWSDLRMLGSFFTPLWCSLSLRKKVGGKTHRYLVICDFCM